MKYKSFLSGFFLFVLLGILYPDVILCQSIFFAASNKINEQDYVPQLLIWAAKETQGDDTIILRNAGLKIDSPFLYLTQEHSEKKFLI